MKKGKKAFTLLELLITIIIIVILSVGGFMYFKSYPIQARDSVRIDSLESVKDALEVYRSENWSYPIPSDISPDIIVDKDWKKWLNGSFWEDMLQKIKWLENLPLDPKTNKPYRYLLSQDWRTWKLVTILESTKKEYVVTNRLRNVTFLEEHTNTSTWITCDFKWVTINHNYKFLVFKKDKSDDCEKEKMIIKCNNWVLEDLNWYDLSNLHLSCSKADTDWNCISWTINLWWHIYNYASTINNNASKTLTSEIIDMPYFNWKQTCRVLVKCDNWKVKQETSETCWMSSCNSWYYFDAWECKSMNCKAWDKYTTSLWDYILSSDLTSWNNETLTIENVLPKPENWVLNCRIWLKCSSWSLSVIPSETESCSIDCNPWYTLDLTSNTCVVKWVDCLAAKYIWVLSKHEYNIWELKNGEEDNLTFDLSDYSWTYNYKLNTKCNLWTLNNTESVVVSCNTWYINIDWKCKSCLVENGTWKWKTDEFWKKVCEIISCNTWYHLEANKCLSNNSLKDCIKASWPADAETFDYILEKLNSSWNGTWNTWARDIPNCRWECKAWYVKDELNSKCLNYCDFWWTDTFEWENSASWCIFN